MARDGLTIKVLTKERFNIADKGPMQLVSIQMPHGKLTVGRLCFRSSYKLSADRTTLLPFPPVRSAFQLLEAMISISYADIYHPFPFFSATHSDAQEFAIYSSDSTESESIQNRANAARSGHLNEFETAVHRLGVFRQGVGDVGQSTEDPGVDSVDVQWPDWQTFHLGFSSKFEGDLADIVTVAKQVRKADGKEVDGIVFTNNQRSVEEFQKVAWTTRPSSSVARKDFPTRGSQNGGPKGSQNGGSRQEEVLTTPPSQKILKWITLWFLFSTMVSSTLFI
ncbi:hypothetical protein J3R30DRAFT_229483 [Lentinula aciculospora]|uniref:Uncharacterized protein n=1 Tax=Lentinula aciculospora TaxID=153920 RepID=A0A9W9DNI7_9AGAR|nr:hypothetical protein J3R30DRAFT_229483 [Lentinula aciculospora]